MRPIAVHVDVVRSVVCVSVCVRHTGELCENVNLNRSRCHFEGWVTWIQGICIRWGSRSDESICRRKGWQDGDVAFYQITSTTYSTIQHKTYNAPYVTRMLFVGAGDDTWLGSIGIIVIINVLVCRRQTAEFEAQLQVTWSVGASRSPSGWLAGNRRTTGPPTSAVVGHRRPSRNRRRRRRRCPTSTELLPASRHFRLLPQTVQMTEHLSPHGCQRSSFTYL